MLRANDIMGGKIVIQLGLASVDVVRQTLREVDQDPSVAVDLINRLHQRGALRPEGRDLVRHRVALYDHVRREAVYLRQLERKAQVAREVVAGLIHELEHDAFRRRLGDVLVRQGRLTPAQDSKLTQRVEQWLASEDERIVTRYRREDHAGVARPLIPNSTLPPDDFKISTLFRGRETRALVDKAALEARMEEARRAAQPQQPVGAADVTLVEGPPPGVGAADVTLIEATPLPAPSAADVTLIEGPPAAPANLDATLIEGPPPLTPRPAPALPKPIPVPTPNQLRSVDDLLALKQIADFELLEVLGRGPQGALVLAQRGQERVALKLLLDAAASDEERGRFQREILLTLRVDHPHVIKIVDHGRTSQGVSYLAVPARPGQDLRAYLAGAGGAGLPPKFVLRVFSQVLAGLQAVHQVGIVHRDLRPETVFVLEGEGHPVQVLDFGLAKIGDASVDDTNSFRTNSDRKVALGAAAYVAPESVTNDDIDARTDLYSLGVVLFELLTGKLPITAESPEGFLTQHMICPPLTLSEACPERSWPPALEGLLATMLAKSSEDRPASCEVVGFELLSLEADLLAQAGAAVEPQPASEAQAGSGFKALLGRLWS